jgi:methylenetetrahydrofolate dehydrogenase (NADP+)/methenyltetrahydrofolate cyclohydrolase
LSAEASRGAQGGAALIDGTAHAAALREAVAATTAAWAAQGHPGPQLVVVLAGDDPASHVYVRNKVKAAAKAGVRSRDVRLPAQASEAEVIATVAALSADPDVDGILVQLPLPKGVDPHRVLAVLDPAKDVDGLTRESAGRLALGQKGLRPCTPAGCVILAKTVAPDLAGRHVVVVGRSILVGRPAALLFLAEDCTVTVAHSRSQDLPALCRQADILLPAVGRPEMIRGDWVKPGAIVIDVGINRVADADGESRLVGDVAFGEAALRASAITPVPGGVGPMTIACLLRNTILAAAARRGLPEPSV